MLTKVMRFLILLISTTSLALAKSAGSPPLPPRPSSTSVPTTVSSPQPPTYAYKTAPPVFTADSVRHTTQGPPVPASTRSSTRSRSRQAVKQPNYYDVDAGLGGSTLASIENTYNNDLPYLEHRSAQEEELDPQNVGFVPSVDFSSILSDLDKVSGQDSKNLLRNPFASDTRNRNRGGNEFPDFFKESVAPKDIPFEASFGSLASSPSETKTRKVKEEDEEGFVDPNVQFRSLFDSAETADGFKPSDFLDYQGDTAGADVSKSSQSRAYPQFTYTGRDGDEAEGGDDEEDEVYRELENPRYRSSYRQVDSRRSRDPYDDSNYYNGERDRSPAPPAAPPAKYRVGSGGGNAKAAAAASEDEETAQSPQSSSGSSGSKGDSPSGKNKCKKVEKLVQDDEEYDSFLEPEEGYDPATYSSRYKRQAGGRRGQSRDKGSKKRPMTCYVCEDEEGRYAERCSYDSKADPKDGSYFHSSSTSFNDNGKRDGGGRGGSGSRRGRGSDRYKRDPEHSAPAPAEATSKLEAQGSSPSSYKDEDDTSSEEVELPKKLQKRQSSGERYGSGYPRQSARQQQGAGGGANPNRRQHEEYDDANDEDYESPYAPYGNDRNRDEYGFADSPQGRRGGGNERTRGRNEFDIRIPTPDYGADPGRGNGDREQDDDYNVEFDYGPEPERGRGGRNRGGGSGSGGGGGGGRARSNSPESDFDIGPGPSYGGGVERRTGSGNGNGSGGRGSSRGAQEFLFGPPADFGRDQGENSRGFNVDFSIPKEFDPDVQLGASNSNNRPIFSNNNDFEPDFDKTYEDHVKQYFPEAFKGNGGGGSSSSTQGPGHGISHSPTSTFRPYDGPPGPGPAHYSSPRPPPPAPVYHHGNRGRSPTQNRHQYSPPPHRPYNGPGGPQSYFGPGGPDDEIGHNNGHDLHQAINSFQQKGNQPRQGCQRVQKGDMSCIVCSDPRGMKKEECAYHSNDPKNQQMAYHEVSEYSSLPPASILPSPKHKRHESTKIVHQESRRVEKRTLPAKGAKSESGSSKEIKDYDFDY